MIRKRVSWLVLLTLFTGAYASAQTNAPVVSAGKVISRTVAGAATVDLATLPVLSAADIAIPGKFSDTHPQTGLSDAKFAALKQQAAQLRFGGASSLAPSSPMSVSGAASVFTPVVTKSFLGIDETCANMKPSDMGLAVSGSYIVQAVNACLGVWNKSGVLQTGFPKSLNTLFNLPANNFATGQFISDPRVLFDFVGNRFVLTAIYLDFLNSRGFILIAISTTANPTSTWFTYQVQAAGAGTCPDFPTLGQGRKGDKFLGAMVVSFNMFPCNPGGFSGPFSGNVIWFLSKTTMYTGAGAPIRGFTGPSLGGVLLDTLQPVNVSDANDEPRALYAIASLNINFGGGQCVSPCNGLVVFAYSNVMPVTGSPGIAVSGLYVGTPSNYTIPPDAPQSGVSNLISTGDTRISGMVTYVGGRMYAAINANNGSGQSEVIAWQLHTTLNDNGGGCTGTFANACPTLTSAVIDQQIVRSYGSNAAYYGTLAPDREGNITMVFNFSGSSFSGSTAYSSNRVTQAPGGWHDSGIFLASGGAPYTQGRWGDYTAIAVDYTSPNAFWFSGMFTRVDGLWGTDIGKTGYTLSNQP